ncbi:hypothetical protein Golob_007493 [Gossypium lobatum]|uniref:Uncharacterized protein n=1 Tax=Gossypium lobatum TaxID=34289 RepID=A0A7J8MCX7_9ROSI|nr:hypothetical protein [Gossypium lobatum]
MGEVKETIEVVKTRTDGLDPMREHFKEYVVEGLSSNIDVVEALINTTIGNLTERNDALEARMTTMKEENEAMSKVRGNDRKNEDRQVEFSNGNGGHSGLHMVRKCPKWFVFSSIREDDELKKSSNKACKRVNYKIKTVNSKVVPTVGVAQGVELQIDEWKGNDNIKINALLVLFIDCIGFLDTRLLQYVVLVSQGIKGKMKVLLAIQLAKDILYGRNINLIDMSAMQTHLEMLEG